MIRRSRLHETRRSDSLSCRRRTWRSGLARTVAALIAIALGGPSMREAHGDTAREWKGHLAVGYAKLFATDAPGGSLSVGAGMDRAVGRDLSAGVDIGYHL